MKKLLSILLALVMVFSLTVPALAAKLPVQDPDSYTDWAKAAWAETCAEEPELTAQFLKELPTWFAQNYDWYDSFEAYCARWNYSAEGAYLELFDAWLWDYEAEQSKKDFITERGGVPGQLNVMLNGQYVKFPDAVPELSEEGRTMVPFRAIFEALGAEVSYDNGGIRAILGDKQLDLQIGSTSMTIRPYREGIDLDGRPEDITEIVMDCAPYLKNDRTYVPVRFIAQALGYEVGWDGDYDSAVIIDRDALAEKIDKDFTIYNKLLARNVLTDKTRKSVGSGKADITLFDTLNGDKSGKATYSYDLAASTAGASGKLEYDFSQMWALIEEYIPMPLDEAGAEEYEKALEMVKSLMKGSAEVRMDLNRGKVYLSMPGLFEAVSSYMQEALEESGVQLPKDAWLSASLDDMDLDGLTGMLKQAPTIGSVMASATVLSSYNAVWSYDDVVADADMMAKLFGDAKFTRKGNADVLTLTKADLVGDDDTYDNPLDLLSKFDYTLTVKDNGDMDASIQCNVALSGSGLNLGDMVAISSKSSTRGGKTEATMDFHIRNTLKATVTIQETVTETDKAPETTPPKDALVLPIDGTLPGVITSPDGPTQLLP